MKKNIHQKEAQETSEVHQTKQEQKEVHHFQPPSDSRYLVAESWLGPAISALQGSVPPDRRGTAQETQLYSWIWCPASFRE